MEFTHLKDLNKRKKADALVLPYWSGEKKIDPAYPLKFQGSPLFKQVLASKDFKGREGEALFFYVEEEPERLVCLLGLGQKEKASVETLRRSYGALTKSCLSKSLQSIHLVLPIAKHLSEEDLIVGVAEGLFLPNYRFNAYKHPDPDSSNHSLLQKVAWIGPQSEVLPIVRKKFTICEAVYYARDLINRNADEITPQYLAKSAKDIARSHPSIKTTVFDKKRIKKEKMGLLLAVNRGSAIDPAFIIMEYRGNPDSSDKTIMIGKGVTYDTGGLHLKLSGGMDTMKSDMSGAAACLGTILAAARLKLRTNLTVVIPSTENGIDAKSYKPGDVYQSYGGKTVEMLNSDAEGRLILADAIAYSIKNLHPSRLIDIATLTGAIEIALGPEAAGVFSVNDPLVQSLLSAGLSTHELLWRMPLLDEYKEKLKSDIADLKNWNGRSAGCCVAATFLRQFAGDSIPWAHIDIAGTAYQAEAKTYHPKLARGFGIRLMIEFLEKIQREKTQKE